MGSKSIVFLLICFLPSWALAADLRVFFIDVGDGESSLIQTPDGRNILLDTGGFNCDTKIVDFLKRKKVDYLDALIITHPHPDHLEGSCKITNNFIVKRKYDNGQSIAKLVKRNNIYHWYQDKFRCGNYEILKQNDVLDFDDIRLRVLNPEFFHNNWNQDSLVIKLEYKNIKFLFTADATIATEKHMLCKKIDLSANVLKVGHHGHSDATSLHFLKKVNPEYAVISTNKNNKFGYPSKLIISRLAKLKIKTYYTFDVGTIGFRIDGYLIRQIP